MSALHPGQASPIRAERLSQVPRKQAAALRPPAAVRSLVHARAVSRLPFLPWFLPESASCSLKSRVWCKLEAKWQPDLPIGDGHGKVGTVDNGAAIGGSSLGPRREAGQQISGRFQRSRKFPFQYEVSGFS